MAAAALAAGLAGTAHSQTPTVAAPLTAAAPPRKAGQFGPSLAKPKAEGVWVSDVQPIGPGAPPGATELLNVPGEAPQAVPGGLEQVPPGAMQGQPYYGGGPAHAGPMPGNPTYSGDGSALYGEPIGMPDASGGNGEAYGDEFYDGYSEDIPGYVHHGWYKTDLWHELHAHRRIWTRLQYLSMWESQGSKLPALVTTSPPGTPQDQAGVLPEGANTTILFGNDTVGLDTRNGGRIDLGYWLVDGEFFGIEGHYFGLKEQSDDFATDSGINPIIGRPFLNVDPNLPAPAQDADLVAFPDFVLGGITGNLTGAIQVRTASDIISAGALYRHLIWVDFTKCCRLDVVGGYRFFRYNDSVRISDQRTFIPTDPAPFDQIDFTFDDSFQADNNFHGGEVGLVAQCYCGRLSLDVVGKIGLGNNRQSVLINGANTTTTGGVTLEGVGGLLAQPTNIGLHKRDQFAVLPELNTTLRLDITSHLRATVGYSLIYLNRVQRSAEAIDTTINPTQIDGVLVGQPRPGFAFSNDELFLHGVNAGLEYRW